ncbi:MAG: asparagine synthase-related protein [Candidatus Nanoarchaeia archaeon]|nr:asparagine synthase-related protein [Candidatus Nanoarchaeia archaeon]
MNEKEKLREFEALLTESVKKLIGENEIGIALSGGLDSSVIAKLAKSFKNKITAYVIGIENSKDFDSAEKAAKEIRIDLKKILINNKEIEETIPIIKKILEDLYMKHKNEINSEILKPNMISISFYLPLFFVSKYSKEKNLISGQGADELFGGYYRYLKMNKEDAAKEINKDADLLYKFGKLRDLSIAKSFNKNLLMPYLDEKIIDFCISLPFDLKIKDGQRKYILRKLGEKIGLSKNISYKEKKAAQYSSGMLKAIKQIEKAGIRN